jgi:GNAT superfamily N-acetyltransferase
MELVSRNHKHSLWSKDWGMESIIFRAEVTQIDLAFALVQEYYAAARVMIREDRDEFRRQYFGDGAGVWLAPADGAVVGCVALRRLTDRPACGEVKRMYLQVPYRGRGIADSLLDALEEFARQTGYRCLYLDTALDMLAAARFYERKGYVRCERYNDNPQAAIFMRKALCQ